MGEAWGNSLREKSDLGLSPPSSVSAYSRPKAGRQGEELSSFGILLSRKLGSHDTFYSTGIK